MNTKHLISLAIVASALVAPASALQREAPLGGPTKLAPLPTDAFEALKRKMRDGITMTADHYKVAAFDEAVGTEEVRRPWGIVVALHQDRASRGEYRGVAPELNQLGLDVLAVDLRAGARRFMVDNGTARSFADQMATTAKPKDAYDDVDFAVRWARELFPDGPLILFGSASSGALALVYTSRKEDSIDGVFTFSPGEYLEGWSVQEEAGKIQVPVYVTCGRGAREISFAQRAVALIDKKNLTSFYPPREVYCLHGVQTLLIRDDASREMQWAGVKKLLETIRETAE
jgi:dienelactone hydrolase